MTTPATPVTPASSGPTKSKPPQLPMALPDQGTAWPELQAQMQGMRGRDVDWQSGRAAVYVFHSGDDVLQVAHDAYGMFISENGLGPAAFPSLRSMEKSVLDMALGLQHAPEGAAGSMTSGGTESIVMALKACRDFAQQQHPVSGVPEIVLPYSAHPAFDKGAHLLGLRVIRTPLTDDYLADVEQMAAAITPNTIMLVGSAPCFPYGLVDPIEALSDLAQAHGLWLHVDACVGGYIAPFMRSAGETIAPFDFAVSGVMSMSADLHKYGYAAKGASTVLYRSKTLRDAQVFAFSDWPCGVMFTPTLAGTRPGGAIAAAWAVMNYLGHDGYTKRAARIAEARRSLVAGLDELGLGTFGDPRLSIVAFGGKSDPDSDDLDLLAVGEGLYAQGWFSSRVQNPDGIQLMLSPEHDQTMDEYLAILGECVAKVRAGGLNRSGRPTSYS